MQILSAKPPFEHTARMRPQTQDEVSVATVMKSHVAQMLEASAEPHAKIFGDESLRPITSVDLKEVQRLARFLPVIVLVHRSTGAHQVAPHKISLAKSSSERLASKGNMIVLRLCGWIQVEHVKTIRELIEPETGKVAVDLTEMTLIDRDVVNFLATCELKGIELRNCPAFLREWITSEKLRIAEEPH